MAIEYNLPPLKEFLKERWSPTVMSYQESSVLNNPDGIYIGFFGIKDITEITVRLGIERKLSTLIATNLVFLVSSALVVCLGFRISEITESILSEKQSVLDWQNKFQAAIESFDKTHEKSVMDRFIELLLNIDPEQSNDQLKLVFEDGLGELIEMKKEEDECNG